MCAQRRFPAALSKLLRLYREAAAVVVAEAEEDRVVSAEIFPDYLIFVDDDTAVNLEYISKALCRQYMRDAWCGWRLCKLSNFPSRTVVLEPFFQGGHWSGLQRLYSATLRNIAKIP